MLKNLEGIIIMTEPAEIILGILAGGLIAFFIFIAREALEDWLRDKTE
jgi:hypothetical protein